MVVGIGAALLVGAVLVLARGHVVGAVFDAFGSGLAAGMGFVIVTAGVAAWLASRRAAKALPGDDLIGSLRRYYERRLRTLRFFAFFGPGYVIWIALSTPRLWGRDPGEVTLRIAVVGAMVLLALNGWFRTRPRLLRELSALEGR